MPNFVSKTVQVHVAMPKNNSKEYLYLCLKRKSDNKIYPNLWQTITGTIKTGEKAVETAIRELKEETGITSDKFYCIPYITSFFDYKKDEVHNAPVFAAVVKEEFEPTLSDEHEEYLWLEYEQAIKQLDFPTHKEGTKIFRDYILNNKLANSFLVKA